MSSLLTKLLIQFTVSFISGKALKCLGKIDYADIVKFSGWCICGGTILEIVKFIQTNSWIAKTAAWCNDHYITAFIKWLFTYQRPT